ncbi:MAG: hypothetical protein FRX48_07890 [Lasallia pustulata]|uniref:Uncharacterized protein n=1 Tax=Lasallia pustulata TaxID=136370 RepID=A0A5M8PGR3_9LECA|nr:MAG: hypothetical protein FRX48_07890 [Lasallia pustulata]
MGLLEFIVANGGQPINASELSEKSGGATLLIGMASPCMSSNGYAHVEAGIDILASIVRIMRVLTATGICQEVAEDTYLANDLAIAITEGGKDGVHHLLGNPAWTENRTSG